MRASFVGRLATGALVAACLGVPASASALTGAEQIAFLNAQRAANGLPADITENPAWSEGCRLHMAWLAANNIFLQHEETPGTPEYTQAGHDAGTSSVLVKPGEAFSSTGVNAFETAPIHLGQMLAPHLRVSGASGGCLSTQAGTDRTFPAPQTFSYPGDGRTGVPISEVSYESPFVPAAAVGLAAPGTIERSVTTGPNLYFFYASAKQPYSRYYSTGRILAASLTGPSGPVEVKFVDNTTPAPAGGGPVPLGTYLAPGGVVIPTAPLKKDSTYTASVTFEPMADSGEPAITRTWSFSTGAASGGGGSTPGGSTTPGGGSTPGDATNPDASALAFKNVKIKTRSVAFESTGAASLWVTIQKQLPRKGKKPAKWSTKRSFAVTAIPGANRVTQDKLGKAKYRLRLRDGSATGKILVEKIVTLR